MSRLELDMIGIGEHDSEEQGYPPLDLFETSSEIIIEIDLPGISADDISVQFIEGTLILEGRARKEMPEKSVRFLCMERVFDRFRRVLRVPVPVDAGSANASLENGVLTVTFTKVSEKRGRPINIRVR